MCRHRLARCRRLLGLGLGLLAGCAPPHPGPGGLPPVVSPGVPARPAPAATWPTAPAGGSRLPAVSALAHRADRALAENRPERAAALVERALDIDPANPWLWYRLARIRLRQGARAQAVELARKARSLAGDDRRLEDLAGRLIREAHRPGLLESGPRDAGTPTGRR